MNYVNCNVCKVSRPLGAVGCYTCAERAILSQPYQGLIGKTIKAIMVYSNGSIDITLDNDQVIDIGLGGGEMDGHFDPPSNRYIKVRLK